MSLMMKPVLIASLLFAAACSQAADVDAQPDDLQVPPANPSPPVSDLTQADDRVLPESRADMQMSFAPIVREAAPAVVNVYTRRQVQAVDPFFSRFFGNQPRQQNSLGSGVIVDPSGVIVTNNHVVAGATELRVVLADRREYEAEILLTDEASDLAVLRVATDEPLPVMNFDMSGDIEVGDLVLAIGNPFGVGQTVTSGIVSALARTDVGRSDYASFIQTDAAINPGNSGGALVDMQGELVGVNTMIFSRSGGSNGIGFAIPAELVRRVVDTALSEGELIRPWLGARLQTVSNDIAQSLGLDRPQGALIGEVYPDSAADRAGLEQGDIILAIDGREVNNDAGARFRLATRAAGEEAVFTVLRDGQEARLGVVVEAAPGLPEPAPLVVNGRNPLSGASVVEMSPAFNERVGLDPFEGGVIVTGIARRSIAQGFGIRPGDRLLAVANERIRTLDQLEDVLERRDGDQLWPVVIERRGRRHEATLRLY
ncbi:Do family serine endopeptidase [Maricaulis sp. CAU 1757]